MVSSLELEKRRLRLALEANEAIRVVFEHEELVCARNLDDPPPPRRRERAAARILKGRDRVEKRRFGTITEGGFERVGVESLVVHVERYDLRAELAQDLQRPVIRRPLDQHALPRAAEA